MVDSDNAMLIFLAAFRTFALTSVATGQCSAALSGTSDALGMFALVAFDFDGVSATVHTPINQVVTFGLVEVSHFVTSQQLNMATRKFDIVNLDYTLGRTRVSTYLWARMNFTALYLAHARLETPDGLVENI